MSVIVLLIAAGGLVAGGFLAAFAWAVRSGQFDDTTTPAVRMLPEDGAGMAARPRPVTASAPDHDLSTRSKGAPCPRP